MKSNNQYYSSLEELYLDNRKLIFAFLQDRNITDIELQDEIASTVWLKVVERGVFFLEKEKRWVKNYLRIMIKTAISDYFRVVDRDANAVKKIGSVLELSDAWSSAEDELLTKEMNLFLAECLKNISDEEAELIILRFKYELPAKEIGYMLGISEGNVRVRQRRAIIKLQKSLKEMICERRTEKHGK